MLITATRVVPGAGGPAILEPGYVRVTDGRVAEVGGGAPPGVPDLALGGGYLVPGLIDLQVNGCFGVNLADVEPAGWARVVLGLPGTGTTAFLPTFVTAPIGELGEALRRAAGLVADPPVGSRVLGVHMEGPFLAATRAGAHRLDSIVPPVPEAVAGLLAAGAGALRVVTLAPEVDGGLAAVTTLASAGVVVSIGHSDATARQVAAAADAGARMVTHLFNAQRPLHHREPGVVGQALTDPRLTCGLIADLSHVAAPACAIAFAAAPGRICLVTDASAAAGMPPGRYRLGGKTVEVGQGDDRAPRLADGTLAGSALRMDQAVANAVAVGVGLAEAVAAATRIPADVLGRSDLGRLEPGAAADLVWLGDDLRTKATWVAGERVYPLDTA
ncbi:MAG TPA: N-acetylglucosamine-6-phosphate deacetylase [Streptosporangiaceae bacterium]|nr:N-acetylglucosamine-6-phosphate deacetylase [Streptosporangiaceae bacterium]